MGTRRCKASDLKKHERALGRDRPEAIAARRAKSQTANSAKAALELGLISEKELLAQLPQLPAKPR